MPVLSAFTPCGLFELSSRPSKAQEFYDEVVQLYGPGIDFTVGTYAEAKAYAWAMGLGRASYELIHAGNQSNPLRACELLPLLELDFQVIPGPNDTIPTRQQNIAAAELLSRGARVENIVNGLKAILGSSFLAYVTANPANIGFAGKYSPNWSESDPTATSFAQFVDVRIPARTFALIDPVVQPGSPAWCAYSALDGSVPVASMQAGDSVVVQQENTAVGERVTVTAVATSAPVGSGAASGFPCFQATFQSAHGVGASVTTGNVPYWWSTQRYAWIVVTAAAAIDAESRRKVHEFMKRVSRACSQWAIVQPSSTTASGGSFTGMLVGDPMGVKPLGAFSYSNSM